MESILLLPNERILKIIPIESCYLAPFTTKECYGLVGTADNRGLSILLEFYHYNSTNYTNVTVYVTSSRLVVVPHNQFRVLNRQRLSKYAFSIPYFSLSSFNLSENRSCGRINFRAPASVTSISISLEFTDKNKNALTSLTSLVSSLIFAQGVSQCLEDKKTDKIDVSWINRIDMGEGLFFIEGSTIPIQTFSNQPNKQEEEILPTYEHSEMATGRFLQAQKLLNRVRISLKSRTDDAYPEEEDCITLKEFVSQDDHYDHREASISIKEIRDLTQVTGTWLAKVLITNCVRFIQRNLPKISLLREIMNDIPPTYQSLAEEFFFRCQNELYDTADPADIEEEPELVIPVRHNAMIVAETIASEQNTPKLRRSKSKRFMTGMKKLVNSHSCQPNIPNIPRGNRHTLYTPSHSAASPNSSLDRSKSVTLGASRARLLQQF
ncbi:Hypothetical protein PP7435_CHR3-2733 [Komagataella phaffii CBS 7435]|uniref:Uncharacterized protein n=2 Tax=Komagataella phaffii TaxID=460519 RepID=C4R3P2_KOMPG|nr:Hypothetical protein PAS_chr3_0149 [Komagataella phaffii GS115]AOA63276.1 GQ67_03166T0 [Komagataella phaffii]CAH2450147.1 Hypothetical protein BQ9382_C3-5750 [Komagataella phaffii CBS 7435]AOA69379.1 GQ68_03151T0 [Komagataella phaffii GS115]CAY70102.1 Hypothetical protein PAS_chr3_0149 [Komagataella phaffii GS115]SCV12305.1 Hypothetical protein PP7435_CHR3-2733 [Komagataella phaffii CBS 7435]